jgi:hypothetical protein
MFDEVVCDGLLALPMLDASPPLSERAVDLVVILS